MVCERRWKGKWRWLATVETSHAWPVRWRYGEPHGFISLGRSTAAAGRCRFLLPVLVVFSAARVVPLAPVVALVVALKLRLALRLTLLLRLVLLLDVLIALLIDVLVALLLDLLIALLLLLLLTLCSREVRMVSRVSIVRLCAIWAEVRMESVISKEVTTRGCWWDCG